MISTFVGEAGGSAPAIGLGQRPAAVAVSVDGSSLYIADHSTHSVREVSAAAQETTIPGNGSLAFSGDGGPATAAGLQPDGVAADSAGDVLISDNGNNRVRLVAAATCTSGCPYGLAATTKGDIYTIAGTGTGRFSGDGGPATAAGLQPDGVVVDSAGDLLISDTNARVRLVAAATCTSGCPYGLAATTKGDIYTIAGYGFPTFSGDGGPATAAGLAPDGVAVDGAGDLLISDNGNNRVRLVAAATCTSGCPYGLAATTKGDIYTIAGNGAILFSSDGGRATAAGVSSDGIAVDSAGDLLISDNVNDRVRLVAAATCTSGCPYGLAATTKGDIYTIAGNGAILFSSDGVPANAAELDRPDGVAVDRTGDVLISDYGNNRVRLVTAATCTSGCPYGLPATTTGDIYTIAGNGTAGFSGDGGPATAAGLDQPNGVAVDSAGDVLISDYVNNRVRLVAAATCTIGCPYGLATTSKGDIYTIAGTGIGAFSGDGGPATAAGINPVGVAVDGAGDVLVIDHFGRCGWWRPRPARAAARTGWRRQSRATSTRSPATAPRCSLVTADQRPPPGASPTGLRSTAPGTC